MGFSMWWQGDRRKRWLLLHALSVAGVAVAGVLVAAAQSGGPSTSLAYRALSAVANDLDDAIAAASRYDAVALRSACLELQQSATEAMNVGEEEDLGVQEYVVANDHYRRAAGHCAAMARSLADGDVEAAEAGALDFEREVAAASAATSRVVEQLARAG